MANHTQIWKSLGFLHRVKFGGVVGKQIVLSIVGMVVVGAMVISTLGNISAVYVGIVTVVFLVVATLVSIRTTLNKHPELAVIEGTELIRKAELEMAAKGIHSAPQEAPVVPSPDRPPLELPGDEKKIKRLEKLFDKAASAGLP